MWRRILVVNVTIGAVQVTGESPSASEHARACPFTYLNVDAQAPAPHPERRFDRIEHTCAIGSTYAQAVLGDLERSALAGVDTRITLLLEQRLHFCFGEVLGDRNGEGVQYTWITGGGGALDEHRVDTIGGIASHGACATAAEELGGAGEQQLSMVIELGRRADGGGGAG